MVSKIEQFIRTHQEEIETLIVTLAQIPAPSLHEDKRARFCKDWLCDQGVANVYIDEVNNVICPFGDINGDLVIIAAHSDVVFADTESLPFTENGNKWHCPGIGDDTANVAVLMMTAKFLSSDLYTPKKGGVLLVIDAAEEGLGNLTGAKALVDTFGDRTKTFISLDCHADELINGVVGSKRYRIEIMTNGGHSYFDFGNTNAIAVMSDMINELYSMPVPEHTHTTYNVGVVEGGTSVNTIAQQASMLFEIRSDDRRALRMMHDKMMQLIDSTRCEDVSICVDLIGERPCAGAVDPSALEELTNRASNIIQKYFGKVPSLKDGSTDCNVFSAAGIPSICFGCILGDGMHTREEYILRDSIPRGLGVALETVLEYFT